MMMNKKWLLLLCLLAQYAFGQTALHVSLTGNDNTGDGSLSNPYASIAKAASEAANLIANNPNQPVRVLVRAGIYRNAGFSSLTVLDSTLYDPQNAGEAIWKQNSSLGTTVRLNNIQGSPNAWIYIQPYPNEQPIIEGDGETAFSVRNCAYIQIEGFEIRGVLDRIPKLLAWKYWGTYRYQNGAGYIYGDRKTEICNTAGISPCADIPPNVLSTHTTYTGLPNINSLNVERPNLFLGKGLLVQLSHHINVYNNNIHHFPGGGLRFTQSDFLQAVGNEVHHNSGRASVGTHGLVAEGLTPNSGDNSNSLKLLIARNRIYSNYNELYSWVQSKTVCTVVIDEGKGLALLRTSPLESGFNGLIRVENNLAYDNGKSGLHANDVDNAEFINNTVFNNAHTNQYDAILSGGNNGGISIQNSNSIKIINNIITVPSGLNPDIKALSEGQNCNNITVSHNLVFGGALSDFVGGYTIADPSFANIAALDASLLANSPAIDAGLNSVAPTVDFLLQTRNNPPEIGAYEYLSAPLAIQNTQFYPQVVNGLSVWLHWSSTVDLGWTSYELLRSNNGQDWELLATVAASQGQNQYQYHDFAPHAGDNYYQLKRINSHTSALSEIVHAHIEPFALQIFPNPTFHTITVKAPNRRFLLYNHLGQAVHLPADKIQYDAGGLSLDLSELSAGLYLLKVGKQTQLVQKL